MRRFALVFVLVLPQIALGACLASLALWQAVVACMAAGLITGTALAQIVLDERGGEK